MITLANNPLRIDPTRTTMIRRRFVAEMTRRFKNINRVVWRLLVQEDAFGLNSRILVMQETQVWRFHTDSQKITAYRNWLQQQIDAGILSVDARGDPWTATYVESSYKKGIHRAYVDTNKMRPDFYEGTQSQFLQEAFHAPETLSKLALLNTRTFEELRGVTAAMSQQMGRTLADGLAKGQGPVTIAREMTKVIDGITRKRANVIARTEVIHAHAEGQLDAFDRLGIKELNIVAEWSTAGDDRVCAQCGDLEGETMTVDEAKGLIPLHPNCRCAWKPAEKKKKKVAYEYRVPERLPETPEVKALLETENRLRAKTAELRKAYKGGDKSLRPALMKAKKELQAVRDRLAKVGGKVPVPTLKPTVPTLKPTPTPKPMPVATAKTKFATAEDYRKYLIQQVKAAKTAAGQGYVDDLIYESRKAWNEYMSFKKYGSPKSKALLKKSKIFDKELKAAKKAMTLSKEAQRKLLDEVDSMVGRCELLADKTQLKRYQSVTDDLLSWVPKNREVSPTFKNLIISRFSRDQGGGVLGQYFYDSTRHMGRINMFVKSRRCFAHEFGHHLQHQFKGFMQAQNKLFRDRTAGEKIVNLFRDIRGKKDKWARYDQYAGRIYADGHAPEVASVGIEHLWANPYRAAIKDPEWFNLIVSQLKGIPTKAGAEAFKVGKAVKVGKGVVGKVSKKAIAKVESQTLIKSFSEIPSRNIVGPLDSWEKYETLYRGTKPDKMIRYDFLKQLPKSSLNEKQIKLIAKYDEFWKDGVHRSVKPIRDVTEWIKKLNTEEFNAIKSWRAGSYNLRKYQLGQITKKELEERLLWTDLRWGGKQLSNAFSRAPNYTGTTYRGTGLFDEIKNMKVGKTLNWNANYSTSKSQKVAKMFLREAGEEAVLFEIKNKAAIDISAARFGKYAEQQEVVTRIGVRFKIIKIEKIKDGMTSYTKVFLEEL